MIEMDYLLITVIFHGLQLFGFVIRTLIQMDSFHIFTELSLKNDRKCNVSNVIHVKRENR